jgi:hypothetical protein
VSPAYLEFLRAAKLATYAAQGDEASVAPLLADSKQLEYSRGDLLYRDIYVGLLRFVGQEVVYRAGRAVWSMSYAGGLAPGVPGAEAATVYRVLRAGLSATPPELPIRGPEEHETEGMRYRCHVVGDIDRFHGMESISRAGTLMYELHFAGGALA